MTQTTSWRDSRGLLGRLGEQWAADYLRALGWRIIDQNWRSAEGELDLVALEPCEQAAPFAVFVEVKTRSAVGYGHPLEAITRAKNDRLRRLAARWLREHPQTVSGMRLDAIGVVKRPGRSPQLSHVRGLS